MKVLSKSGQIKLAHTRLTLFFGSHLMVLTDVSALGTVTTEVVEEKVLDGDRIIVIENGALVHIFLFGGNRLFLFNHENWRWRRRFAARNDRRSFGQLTDVDLSRIKQRESEYAYVRCMHAFKLYTPVLKRRSLYPFAWISDLLSRRLPCAAE